MCGKTRPNEMRVEKWLDNRERIYTLFYSKLKGKKNNEKAHVERKCTSNPMKKIKKIASN